MNSSSSAPEGSGRRDFLKAAGSAAFTTSIFTGNVKGANDKLAVGFIGVGTMGSGNLGFAMKTPGVQAVAVCDVWQPHLERAQAQAKAAGHDARAVKDFREILADKSIDAVCIATPDHWHAYMEVEACKAGKDVYVEKPACVYVEEGQKMIEAARKYKRVVQAGTMQRSGGYFQKAVEIVQSGQLGDITFCRTWQASGQSPKGWGNPPDADPPAGLDWDMWLGPAPQRPFNENRWGIVVPESKDTKRWSTFRYFWDYAGGAMTDWCVHLLDIVQFAFHEQMPTAVSAIGSKFYVKDNVETPDTMLATWLYPGFVGSYESRTCSPTPLFDQAYGTSFHGTKGTLVVNRGGYQVMPAGKGSGLQAVNVSKDRAMGEMNLHHWANFVECVKTRQKPISEIETCVRTTTSCLLANIAMRTNLHLDWDEKNATVMQPEAKPYLRLKYREPWKLEI
jgi:predicted dehydrogenase